MTLSVSERSKFLEVGKSKCRLLFKQKTLSYVKECIFKKLSLLMTSSGVINSIITLTLDRISIVPSLMFVQSVVSKELNETHKQTELHFTA